MSTAPVAAETGAGRARRRRDPRRAAAIAVRGAGAAAERRQSPPRASRPLPRRRAGAADGERARALLEGRPAAAADGRRASSSRSAPSPMPRPRAKRASKVEKLGLKTYTQVAQTPAGSRIRVRVGPFATRDEAEAALAKVKAAGLAAVRADAVTSPHGRRSASAGSTSVMLAVLVVSALLGAGARLGVRGAVARRLGRRLLRRPLARAAAGAAPARSATPGSALNGVAAFACAFLRGAGALGPGGARSSRRWSAGRRCVRSTGCSAAVFGLLRGAGRAARGGDGCSRSRRSATSPAWRDSQRRGLVECGVARAGAAGLARAIAQPGLRSV